MARAARRFSRRTGSRPNRGWSTLNATTFTGLAANTVALVASFVPTNPGLDLTVLRVVGNLSISSDQSAGGERQIGAFGMIRVTEAALAVGVTAMPDPVAEADDDGWFVYQSFAQRGDLSVTNPSSFQYDFDSKAKRIIEGEGIAIAVMITNADAAHGLQFAISLRILSQLRGS